MAAHLETAAEMPRIESCAIPRVTRYAQMENEMNHQPLTNVTRIDPTASEPVQARCSAIELPRSPLDEMEVPWAALTCPQRKRFRRKYPTWLAEHDLLRALARHGVDDRALQRLWKLAAGMNQTPSAVLATAIEHLLESRYATKAVSQWPVWGPLTPSVRRYFRQKYPAWVSLYDQIRSLTKYGVIDDRSRQRLWDLGRCSVLTTAIISLWEFRHGYDAMIDQIPAKN